MSWCCSTRASVATVLSMYWCISRCLGVNCPCFLQWLKHASYHIHICQVSFSATVHMVIMKGNAFPLWSALKYSTEMKMTESICKMYKLISFCKTKLLSSIPISLHGPQWCIRREKCKDKSDTECTSHTTIYHSISHTISHTISHIITHHISSSHMYYEMYLNIFWPKLTRF